MKKRRLFIILTVVLCMLASAIPTFAASGLSDDPNVIVVSPTKNAVMTSGKVLVSVKMTAPRNIVMSLYQVTNDSKTLVKSESYSSSKNLSYYTRQLTGLSQGVYCVDISTINSAGKAIYRSEIYIKVTNKTSDSVKVDVFNSQTSSSSFWSTLLKKLLG